MTRKTYRILNVSRWVGGSTAMLTVPVGWMQILPIWQIMLTMTLFGFPAVIISWLIKDVTDEELANG